MKAVTPAPPPAREVRLPPDRFYWGVLDVGPLPRGATRMRRLGYLFESVLPVTVESVQAVYAPLDEGRVLACGMGREPLSEEAAAGVIVLGPNALPPFAGDGLTPSDLNLLAGEFEPKEIRRARARVVVAACAAIAALAAAVGWGQIRRASAHAERAAAFDTAVAELYEQVLPPSSSAIPPAARLTAELRSLDRTRGDEPAAPAEIAPTLAAVLASWPSGLHASTESLSASDSAITLAVRVPDPAAAERFEREIQAPPEWGMNQPDVQRERDGIIVRVRMEPPP